MAIAGRPSSLHVVAIATVKLLIALLYIIHNHAYTICLSAFALAWSSMCKAASITNVWSTERSLPRIAEQHTAPPLVEPS
jgi:hypothetical protein